MLPRTFDTLRFSAWWLVYQCHRHNEVMTRNIVWIFMIWISYLLMKKNVVRSSKKSFFAFLLKSCQRRFSKSCYPTHAILEEELCSWKADTHRGQHLHEQLQILTVCLVGWINENFINSESSVIVISSCCRECNAKRICLLCTILAFFFAANTWQPSIQGPSLILTIALALISIHLRRHYIVAHLQFPN